MSLSQFVSSCRCQRLGVPHLRTRHPLADRRAARSAGPPAQQKHPAVSRGVAPPSGPNTPEVLKQEGFSWDVVVLKAVSAHFSLGISSGVCLRAAVTSTKWPVDVQLTVNTQLSGLHAKTLAITPHPRRGCARFLQLKAENGGEKLSC